MECNHDIKEDYIDIVGDELDCLYDCVCMVCGKEFYYYHEK